MKTRLKELRKKRDLTYREVESLTGIDYSNISKIEKGQRKPTIDQAWTLADFFDVSIDYLVYRTKQENSELSQDEVKAILSNPKFRNQLHEELYNLILLLNDNERNSLLNEAK